ncbi:Holliday junction branch migration protein RuvA [Candidatus Saccharibacteria bacterium]|nr:MAG: Holliday junction branch migration protein RuvA [Candidatus Saccharibacteria bacterium]
MIAMLWGQVAETIDGMTVIDCGGVGYGVFMTTEDQGRLQAGQKAALYVYEHIREQQHDLFAFLQRDTKQLFEQLLGVNGVGPKMALSILSVGNASDVRVAIAGGDTKYIAQAAGVGKRVAERVVVDLKDKVGLEGVDLQSTGILQSEQLAARDEAAEALVSLGYSVQDAAAALAGVDVSLPVEDRIKQALKGK